MSSINKNNWLRYLIAYYGILQTTHLFFLGRAGLIMRQSGKVPFPASPPLGGWTDEIIPFLMGMAAVDVIAAGLGIYFSYFLLFKNLRKVLAGVVSLSIALSSAVVYLIGTLSAGAWADNPISYLIVATAFAPIIPLFYYLISDSEAT